MAVTGCGSSPENTPGCRISSRRVSAAKRLAQGFVGRCVREALKPSIQVALPRRQYRRGRFVPMELQALADGFDAHIDNVARIGDRARLNRLADDLLLLRLVNAASTGNTESARRPPERGRHNVTCAVGKAQLREPTSSWCRGARPLPHV